MVITKTTNINANITIPGDKSISHRAVMLGSLAKGITRVKNFLIGDDCLATIKCFEQMGIKITQDKDITIYGNGLNGLKQPSMPLDVGNSGTTIRLLSGILAGQDFSTTISGDDSIEHRPMNRILIPLRQMNADITASKDNSYAPLHIKPSTLQNTLYNSPVASAQVKSSVLLAGLYTEGETSVVEPVLSRNHTELMLTGFGAKVISRGTQATVEGFPALQGLDINIPGDISSAAFFLVAGLIVPSSEIYMENIGVNPTRAGIITVLQDMGGDITLHNQRIECGEPVCDILVRSSDLKATSISGDIIPTLIDEIPVIAVAACFAKGTTTISDAKELKVKECDRIAVMTCELSKMGADIVATDDGLIITGTSHLTGAPIETHGDHRVAMSLAIAGLVSEGETLIHNSDCVNISFPQFFKILDELC
ncbi:MAG TPA: 3-phosphoshikimate 1-carboxyvinyltransferase [Epulopiscium sp.]|nr:3-phosphoshikimate 1-carboxyvinyltransferase [Candidatus Epulonipiscium sp.]